ncbi:MAG: hypothetical protein GY810_11305 [Aureispira sp.]|nr:hypothetical protein [Aureispira sp.]
MSSSTRAKQIKKLQDKVKALKEAKKKADEYAESISWASDQFEKYSKDLDKQTKRAEEFLDTLSTISDLVDSATSGSLQQSAEAIVDSFLDKHANWEGDIFDTGNKKLNIGPFFGFLNVVVSFWAGLKAELKAKRKNLGIEASAKVEGSARVGVGISLGFSIPVVGDVSIGGGIEGGPDLTGRASFALAVQGSNLTAIMEPATLDIDMAASIYMDMPSIIPEFVIDYIPSLISALKTRGSRILYPLGSVNILVMKTPMYSLSFNMRRASFSKGKKMGAYSVDLNPTVKRKIKEVKEAIYEAADNFVDSLNPLNWDWNPFD